MCRYFWSSCWSLLYHTGESANHSAGPTHWQRLAECGNSTKNIMKWKEDCEKDHYVIKTLFVLLLYILLFSFILLLFSKLIYYYLLILLFFHLNLWGVWTWLDLTSAAAQRNTVFWWWAPRDSKVKNYSWRREHTTDGMRWNLCF